MSMKIAFTASRAIVAQTARAALIGRYGDVPQGDADVIVALGGDGFMLQTLHDTQDLAAPVYGMNRGTIGFLMNSYGEADLVDRVPPADLFELAVPVGRIGQPAREMRAQRTREVTPVLGPISRQRGQLGADR